MILLEKEENRELAFSRKRQGLKPEQGWGRVRETLGSQSPDQPAEPRASQAQGLPTPGTCSTLQ